MRTLIVLALAICGFGAPSFAESAKETNAPPVLSIPELLKDKQQWKCKRVEVRGFYVSDFERSALYETEDDTTGPRKKSLWIDYREAPGHAKDAKWVKRGFIRIIGTFDFRELGSGHLNRWPAELAKIELVESIGDPAKKTSK